MKIKTLKPFALPAPLRNFLRHMFPAPAPLMETEFAPSLTDDVVDSAQEMLYYAGIASVVLPAAAIAGYAVFVETLRHGGLAEAAAYWVARLLWQVCTATNAPTNCGAELPYLLAGFLTAMLVFAVFYLVVGRGMGSPVSRHQQLLHEHLRLLENKLSVIYETIWWKMEKEEEEEAQRAAFNDAATVATDEN